MLLNQSPPSDWATQTVGQGGGGAARRKQLVTGARGSNWMGDSGSCSICVPRVHPVEGHPVDYLGSVVFFDCPGKQRSL